MLRIMRHYLRAIGRGTVLDKDLEREMKFHLDMEAEKHRAAGLSPADAEEAARRNFGGVQKAQEACRDERRVSLLDSFLQDIRYGLRALRRSPGFALAAVATLGLGIGANAAMFSLIRGVLLKPLPYGDGGRLQLVRQSAPLAGRTDFGVSIKELYDYRAQLSSFDGLVEFHQMSFDLLERGEPDRVDTGVVSHNFFDVLGVKPILGRTFTSKDEAHGAEAVLILSHSYWQSRFGGDPNIVGQVFVMNDRPHTVVGVLPPVPLYPQEEDVYMPTSACPFRAAAEQRIEQNRRAFSALVVFGKLKPETTPEQASAEIRTVGQRFATQFPETYRPELGFRATGLGVLDELTRNARPMLLVLIGVTVLVLLISCANVANLALARMLRRSPELSLRLALGASRGRVLQQLLTESVIVAAISGAVGLVMAWSALGLLTRFIGRLTSRTTEISLDGTVLLFTIVITLLTGLLFGMLPALTSVSTRAEALHTGTRQVGAGQGRRRLQQVLIVAQVAIAFVLLAGAGQLLVSFYRLYRVDPGYHGEHVLSAEVFGNFSRYKSVEDLRRLYLPLIQRLESRPGVRSAAITNAVPLSGLNPLSLAFLIQGRDPGTTARPSMDVRIVTPRYFDTLGIPLRRGRVFTDRDDTETQPVAIINEAMTRYWHDGDPIGSRISTDDGKTWTTVVGVVGNVRQFALDREAEAQAYIPLAQSPVGLGGRVLIRVDGNPLDSARLVREEVRALDPNLPVENVQTVEELRRKALSTPRLTAMLLSLFAGVALAVTLAGIAGMIAIAVTQRTPEFGLRMALGASRTSVLRLVLGQALAMVGAGLALGVPLSMLFAGTLSSYLFDTRPVNPLTLTAVAAIFLATAALACLGPATRATRVDPMLALRAD
jgi:putative ABC transport system permease protein